MAEAVDAALATRDRVVDQPCGGQYAAHAAVEASDPAAVGQGHHEIVGTGVGAALLAAAQDELRIAHGDGVTGTGLAGDSQLDQGRAAGRGEELHVPPAQPQPFAGALILLGQLVLTEPARH